MDTGNLEALYRRYGPLVLRRCGQLLRDSAEAEDAMQEVFMQILRNPGLIEAEFPSSLLYKIATNACLNRLRGRARRAESRDEERLLAIASHDDVESRSAAGRLLDKIFNRLPDPARESTRVMAVLHFVDGLTLEEVAKETSLSVSGVRKRLRGLRESSLQLAEAARG
jgi:RNA polymerase sigma-70 factor (ECF subfamily)